LLQEKQAAVQELDAMSAISNEQLLLVRQVLLEKEGLINEMKIR
jgi:hypothetical protein